MAVCVVYNPNDGSSRIIKVSDNIPNATAYARQMSQKIVNRIRKNKQQMAKVMCDVPDYSVYDKPLYVLYRIIKGVFSPVAVGDDVKRLFDVSPYSKSVVMPGLVATVNTIEELLSLTNNF